MTTPAAASRPDYPDEVRLPTPPRVEERGGERWYWVAPAASLPPGTRAILDIEGREVGLFNVGGRYFAFRNRCPHLGGPLCGGKVLDLVISSEGPGDIRLEPTSPMLVCPWHGWEFDLSTGQSYCDPGRWQARRYRVTVERTSRPPSANGSPDPTRRSLTKWSSPTPTSWSSSGLARASPPAPDHHRHATGLRG